MNTKVMKYQIIKPLEMDWKTFGKILREIRCETRKAMNKTIQYAWEYSGYESDYKERFEEYPKTKEILNYSSIHGYAYDKLKSQFTTMNSSNFSQSIKRAADKWKNNKKDVLLGNCAPPVFKKDCPIDIVKKAMEIYNEDKCYMVNLSLLSLKSRKELEMKSGQILVKLKVGDNTQKAILDRILNGEYKLSASQIIERKNKWFLNITYQFESKPKKLNENKILGIDLGVTNVATMQIFDAKKQKYQRLKFNECMIDGKELIHFRQSTEARKRELQKASKWAGNGRCGHGYKTRMKPVNKLGDKIAKFRDTYNHKISKYIVNMAVKNQCAVIQMENLKGFTGLNKEKFLSNWSYYDLQEKIEYKAKEQGIEVVYINPRYTSKRCSECGTIHEENRNCKKNQTKFKCVICGHEENADINAAKNISNYHIEEIIEEYIKTSYIKQEENIAV
ncbi:MAG: RNA-guided endonuclease InsQ/TnpB family protein [Candidatus Woesearchaeota archaeon]